MEDIINQIDGKVQVIFKKSDGDRTYTDALWFSQEEYSMLTQEEILAMQDQRFSNWLAAINAPPTEEILITEPEIVVSSQE